MEQIYLQPHDYDLEHEGDTQDVDYFLELAKRLKPRRVLELACGSGRVTLPLAQLGAEQGFSVTGLDTLPEMLDEAKRKASEASQATRESLTLLQGDMRDWKAEEPFDLIITPCSSVSHLLELEDQIAAWKTAYENLNSDGRFVVDVSMPDLAIYADSFKTPLRQVVEIDRDTQDPQTGERLIRYKTTRYLSHEQKAEIRFLYDKYTGSPTPERFISDYESHVYFPREIELLFKLTGFEIEAMEGGYKFKPLTASSRNLIARGVKR